MQITSVEKNKKNKDRYSVFIDGKFSFSISEDDYLSLNLYDKSEVSQDEIDYIRNTINFRAAKNCALKFLSYKLRTENEVRMKLQEDGFDVDSIQMAIEELNALGYINNKIYVQKYIFDRSKLKPKSKRLIKLELLDKGIQEAVIDEVLNDWNIDESAVAEGLIKRKFGKYDFNDVKIKRKAYMFLKHRGYSHDVIETILGKIE